MVMPQYIISHVMLEEHRRNVERLSPNPDLPEPIPARDLAFLARVRQQSSGVLRTIADRLEPAAAGLQAPQRAASAD